jgi:thiamine-phosphate pyrophosphorylase
MKQPQPRSYPHLRGLYAVTPDEPDTDKLILSVAAVLAGGCRWLQYRHKAASAILRRRQAKALNDLCLAHEAALIINDDIRLAKEVGAAGVHLGKDDASPKEARKMLGEEAIIGISCYQDMKRAERFARSTEGSGKCAYLAFGAAYPSLSKPEAMPAPAEIFRRACNLSFPVCAIGGITLENAVPLIRIGVTMVAVIHDIFSRPVSAITARVRAYQKLFEESSHV